MVVNQTFDNDQATYEESEIFIPREVRFWLLLLLNIPSVICSCLLLYHFFESHVRRNQLKNHLIIVLLILGLFIELVDIPLHLSFFRLGIVQPSVPFICILWWFIDLGLYNGCVIIMAWSSVHLNLLIFHDRIYFSKRKRFLFHYLPLISLVLYIIIFYIIAIVFPPCENEYDYRLPVCNDFPCYLNHTFLGIWDSTVNSILPTFIISISSFILFMRMRSHRRRVGQSFRWHKQRRMIIQLLLKCVLYLIPNIPLSILVLSHLCGLSETIGVQVQAFFDFLCYFNILIYPFLCVSSLPKMRKRRRVQNLLTQKNSRQVATISPLYIQ